MRFSALTGLALAASLEYFGITPVVAEIGDASLSRGLALMLTSNAVMTLRRVGLDRIIIDRGIVLERIVYTDPSGNPIEDDHDLRPSNARYAPNLGITRDGLMSGLTSAARAQIHYGTTLASVGGPVKEPDVAFSDSMRGRFDLVVGADGTTQPCVRPSIQTSSPRTGHSARGGQSWSASTGIRSSGSAPPPAASLAVSPSGRA
jgi:2-polyprenyl-6-methoxyphenol hydroxylase-like FAD-dependent oxidoreductase